MARGISQGLGFIAGEMAMTGEEDKEMRIPGSLTYDPLENLEHSTPHLPPPDHPLQQERSRGTTGSKPKAPMTTTAARYRECLKNHAASIGGNVTDGCGEFMPSGEEGTLESFRCAACNCHRNFHRKDLNNAAPAAIFVHHHPPPPPPQMPSPSMNHHHHHRVVEPVSLHGNHWTGMVQPVKMAFGGSASGAADSSSEELNFNTYQSTSVQPPPQYVLAKKRFRTKFTPDQKEKMLAFAEKLGWRIPREDDTEVQRFCAEVGVKRQVFKVWMHNNKNSGKKNPEES